MSLDREKHVCSTSYISPVGTLELSATEYGLCGLAFEMGADKNTLHFNTSDESWTACACVPHLQDAIDQLDEYFAGTRMTFDLDLDIVTGTDFQRLVWNELRNVKFGQTRTYGQIAASIGRAGAARAVGGANNKNPIAIIIPCHRIIGSSGDLVGFGGGLGIKQALLEHERAHPKR